MYEVEYKPSVDRIFLGLAKRNKKQLEIIYKKIQEVRQNPQHYKNLRYPLQHLKRVHIGSSFVLVFSVDERRKVVIVEDYDHHDNIYKY